jgi:MerR family redox-sensitive transcriptional activator SoxR
LLPQGQAPSAADWRAIGARMQSVLAAKITLLQKTQALLDGCIGCGCLSLERCALYNPNDRAGRAGPGPRFLLGNHASDFEKD